MNLISHIQKSMMQIAALAFVVGLVVAAPQSSSANTGAGTTIVNVVTVDYQSPGGVLLVASASATVTVTLVQQPVLLVAVGGVTTGSTPSGAAIPYTFKATSQANGRDAYLLNATAGTLQNASAPTVVFELVNNPGVAITKLFLASSVISDVTAAGTLVFPAGTVVDLAANDIVVINNVDYLVQSVSGLGTAAAPNVSTTTTGTITPEVSVSVVLVANPAGSNTAPAFTPSVVGGAASPDIGTLVTEQQTFIAKITSTTSTPGDGSASVDITVGGPTVGPVTAPITAPITTVTTVQGANLTITKEVSTDGGLTFAATGSGAPLSTLIYRTTVSNGGGGDATSVIVSDPMPAYTSYTLNSASSAVVLGALPVGGVLPAAAAALTDAVDVDGYNFAANTATLNVATVASGSSVVLFYTVTIQ